MTRSVGWPSMFSSAIDAVGGRVDGDRVGGVGELRLGGLVRGSVPLVDDRDGAGPAGEVEAAEAGVEGEDVWVVADNERRGDGLGVEVDGEEVGFVLAGDERQVTPRRNRCTRRPQARGARQWPSSPCLGTS